ncbi:MAG: arsenite methyltransferase [Pirellulaceae bacterium]
MSLQQAVQANYGAAAGSGLSSNQAGVRAVAVAFGYSPDELAAIPAEANMGLSCGNPTALAGLRPGETVVDLGCGGGLDVFLAARRVGPSGRAIGIDMTPEMLALARKNAAQAGLANVEFHQATIDRLPLADGSVDCVISNCVINLAPDKPAVFHEIARVLRPGGRVALSDIALKQPLPAELASDLMAYVGCIAGAISLDEYRAGLLAAGFSHVEVLDSGADLNAYAQVEGQAACCSPAMERATGDLPLANLASGQRKLADGVELAENRGCQDDPRPREADASCLPSIHGRLAELLLRYNVNDYAASVKVLAVKPRP